MKFNFGKLLLIFTIIPFVELSILLELAARTSALTTLALIILTGIVGAYFAKDQGRRVLTAIQAELNTGRMPGNELLHGLCVLIGGILLLTPGILTDLFGFTLLFPSTRTLYIDAMKKYMKGHFNLTGVHMHSGGASGYQYYD
jgi:UPF0716 protein FxsA